MEKIFINEFGRLRSGWRLALFVFLFIAASLILVTLLRIGYAFLHAAIPTPPYARAIFELGYRSTLLISALGARLFVGEIRGRLALPIAGYLAS